MTVDGADQTTTKRPVGRPKGSKNTPAQTAASKANIKKANAARAEAKAKRKAGKAVEKPRWKQLEDGDITVRDLSQKELIKKACANNDGSWEGRRHQLPLRIVRRMEAEFIRRARDDMWVLKPAAKRALKARLDDDDNPAQQLAAAKMVYEYIVGKVPDVVHVSADTEYDRLQSTGFVILRGTENVSVDDSDDDIVDAEVVEEGQEALG